MKKVLYKIEIFGSFFIFVLNIHKCVCVCVCIGLVYIASIKSLGFSDFQMKPAHFPRLLANQEW
jgi:hypothetical protein